MSFLVIEAQTKFAPQNVNVSLFFIISSQKIMKMLKLNSVILGLTATTQHASVKTLDAQRTTAQGVWLIFLTFELHNCPY